MSEYLVPGLVGSLAGAAATLAATVVQAGTQRRREAGTVQTSDAQTLFQASNQLIQMLLATTQQLTDRLDRMSEQFGQLTDRVEELVRQQDELLKLQRDQTRTLHELSAQNGGTGGH